jgi:hypothetical protein
MKIFKEINRSKKIEIEIKGPTLTSAAVLMPSLRVLTSIAYYTEKG